MQSNNLNAMQATMIGCLAILLWSLDTLFNLFLIRLPVFQSLGTSWLICFVMYAFILSIRGEWKNIKQPFLIVVVGVLGCCGAHWALVWGLRLAPAAQICTLAGFSPIIVIIFSKWMFAQHYNWRTLCGVIIGFAGVWLVLTNGNIFSGFSWNYIEGYFFALASCAFWSCYVLMTRKHFNVTSHMMGIYIGIGSVFALAYHFTYEQTVIPTLMESLLLLLQGIFTLGLSYFCWDFAIKRGHFELLNAIAYFNPIVAMVILSSFSISEPTIYHWSGALCVVLGTLLCSNVYHGRKKKGRTSVDLYRINVES